MRLAALAGLDVALVSLLSQEAIADRDEPKVDNMYDWQIIVNRQSLN